MNKLYKKCLLENANKDELLKTKDQLLVIEKEKIQTSDERCDRLNRVKENHEGVIEKLQEKIVAQEKLIKAQDKVIEDKVRVHQRFVDCSEESDTISKELISELETQKSENLAALKQMGDQIKNSQDTIMSLKDKLEIYEMENREMADRWR